MNEQLIYKYLSRQASRAEELELLEWLTVSEDNKKIFFEMKAIWSAVQHAGSPVGPIKIENALLEINNKIDQSLPKNRRVSFFTNNKKWIAYAAAVVFLIMLPLTYLINDKHNISSHEAYVTTNSNDIKTIILSDGTKVWLNSKTSLTYPEKFTGERREVILDGEAFFEVTKDATHPFIVKTSSFRVKVLGTSFNINSYKDSFLANTVLESGKIQLQTTEGQNLITLRPGQQAIYTPGTKDLEVRNVAVNEYTSWRYGLVSMNNVTIQDIVKSLEETYKISIQIDSVHLRNHRYNFTYKKDEGAEEAIRMLQYMTGLNCKVK